MVLGRRGLSAILLAIAGLVFYTVFLAVLATEPSAQTGGGSTGGDTNGVEGCENPEVVDTFTGSNSQITPPFEITGNTFRLSYEADLIESGEFQTGSLFIDSVDEEDGLSVPFGSLDAFSIDGPSNDSTNVLEGPGTFSLEIEARNVEYTVTVEDCVGSDPTTPNPPAPRPAPTDVIRTTIPPKPLPPTGGITTGGLPVYAMVVGSILAGTSLLGLGIVIRRRPRG